MADQYPVEPGWQRNWQRELGAQRHLEKVKLSGATDLDKYGVTAQERRRFQRIEFFKTLGVLFGSLVLLALVLIIMGIFIH